VAIRYRYYEEAPGTVTLPAGELMTLLPSDLRGGGEPGHRAVEIPCADLLAGNTPRIALGRLQELLPELIQIPEGRDPAEKIPLPAGWIALNYKLVTRREELPPEEAPAATAIEEKPAPALPKEDSVIKEIKATNEPPAPKIVSEAVLVGSAPPPLSEPSKPKEVIPPPASGESDLPKPRLGLFASLPIFRRHASVETPAVEVIQAVPALGKNAKDAKDAATPEAKNEVPVERKDSIAPAVPPPTGVSLALEPLWKLDPQDPLADPTALQALFMTEEKLTLERVISKAGELPGLKACVLAHGDKVLCATNTASGVDLRTLSGQAMTMLGQIRESTASMGLGAVPAVTLHAEQGALSFLHNGELCLLVLHADRGFVPGVKERLQEMLGHLKEARPALPNTEGLKELKS
jgi:predicted regulator of Ras-like GTPase activity (Roadblock/LC7/MglB family)